MRLALVVNDVRPTAKAFAEKLVSVGRSLGFTLLSDQAVGVDSWGEQPADVILAVGGDGTVLEAMRRGVGSDTPVLGFNLGTVGFLAEVEPEELQVVMAALAAGDFRVDEMPTLCASLDGEAGCVGINDVVIEKIESQRLVVLDTEIDGEPFLTYRADGLVVATATGSTAYSFSAGGPLVDPSLETLLVIPVAPHSLFNRALVLPLDTVVRCRVAADRSVRVSIDGVEAGTLHMGEYVEVTRSEVRAKFVRFDGRGFPARVRRKFGLE